MVAIACFLPGGAVMAGDAFVHPGLLQTGEQLDFMRAKVQAKEEPWKSAYEQLCAQSYSSMDFQPKAIAHIIRGPYGHPAVGDRDLMESANAAYSQALQWFITRDPAHAHKAGEIIDAWSGTLQDFSGNDAKLLDGWTGHVFCNAAEILRHSGAAWDDGLFRKMLLTVYYPLIKDFFPEANGNWDAAIMDTMLSMGVYLDDRAMFQRAVDHFLRGQGNGGIGKYVYPSGQCEESSRDQGHTQLGLGEMALACQVAWSQGVDLYGALDNRLALGIEYTARYMAGEDVPATCELSTVGRGKFSDIYEIVWQHYHFDRGMNMPWVRRALEKTRNGHSWSRLTFYRGTSTNTVQVPAPKPSDIADNAGAQDKPTASAPAGAIEVTPWESIQAALDAATHDGWVVLEKGNFILKEPLRVPSGVTLSGQGKETVVFFEPVKTKNPESAAIVNESGADRIVLRDFVLDGGSSVPRPTSEHPDPNAPRRARSRPNAPNRAGIVFDAANGPKMRELGLEHLTVRHWTRNGLAISNAASVQVKSCDFIDNGASVAPGPGSHHDVEFDHVTSGFVLYSRLDDSPSGDGLRVKSSSDVHVYGCELARNGGFGLQATDISTMMVSGSLAEANDYDGIFVSAAAGNGLGIEKNRCRNNGGAGIRVDSAASGYVRDNVFSANGSRQPLQIAGSPRLDR
jgi:parallel beta-helix repeat protein